MLLVVSTVYTDRGRSRCSECHFWIDLSFFIGKKNMNMMARNTLITVYNCSFMKILSHSVAVSSLKSPNVTPLTFKTH